MLILIFENFFLIFENFRRLILIFEKPFSDGISRRRDQTELAPERVEKKSVPPGRRIPSPPVCTPALRPAYPSAPARVPLPRIG